MKIFNDINGKLSVKRVLAFILVISGLVLTFLKYDISYVYFVLGSGIASLGITPFEKRNNE